MARSSEKVTPQELKTFEEFFAENPQWDTVANGDSFAVYLLETWQVDITPDTLAVAARQLSEAGRLEILTPAHIQYLRVAKQNPDAAQRVSDWYANQNVLVKDGGQALENQTAILTELRGREITSTTIHQAIGRAGHGHGLHYVQTPRPVDPRQHQDDGKGWMPRNETNLSARDHAARAQRASAAATPAPSSPNEPDAWESLCRNMLAHGTHSFQENMRRVFEAKGEKSWRELHREMEAVRRSYENLVSHRY